MFNQKESVYNALKTVCADKDIDFVDGSTSALSLSKDVRDAIADAVVVSIEAGETVFSEEAKTIHDTTDKKRKYVVGLLNNWFRKDTRLNGGTKYETKNPGTRQTTADPQVKELKKLLSLKPDSASEIQAAIDARLAEIKAEKAPKIEVNADLIPDELKGLLG